MQLIGVLITLYYVCFLFHTCVYLLYSFFLRALTICTAGLWFDWLDSAPFATYKGLKVLVRGKSMKQKVVHR